MKKLAKLLTFWIPIKQLRHKLRKNLSMFFISLIPIRKNWIIMYDTFSKNGNGDSIRPIAEELKRNYSNFKLFFVSEYKRDIDLADEVLILNSNRYNYVLNRAKYLISPMDLPEEKRKNQIWVMTYHGSPIKKLYLSRDENNIDYINYVKPFKYVDFYCDQGSIQADIITEAFNLEKNQLLNCGLPRNDILFKNDLNFKKNLRLQLGLPFDKKIILYCPTWRRYDYKCPIPFDIDCLRKYLQNEYVILMRSHVGKHTWVDKNNNPIKIFDNKFIFDGGQYPEVTSLYTISDILISDYSSAIFDFAITRKPQILYIYDYEKYKKEFGLYFDYKDFSPFPKVKNEEEIISSIKNYPDISQEYEQFINNYLTYENGNATDKILEKIGIKN